MITTVFRDRARGKSSTEMLTRQRSGARSKRPRISAQFSQQVDALAASGDLKAARDVARKALAAGIAR